MTQQGPSASPREPARRLTELEAHAALALMVSAAGALSRIDGKAGEVADWIRRLRAEDLASSDPNVSGSIQRTILFVEKMGEAAAVLRGVKVPRFTIPPSAAKP